MNRHICELTFHCRLAFFVVILAGSHICQPSTRADQVLYDNEVTSISSPYYSDVSNGQILADDFVLTGEASLTAISWSGVYGGISPLETDFFEIKILTDVDPTDGVRFLTLHTIQTSEVNRIDSGADFGSLDIFNYSANISDLGITLNGNETYWLNIYNETQVDLGANAGWAWSADARFGNMAYRNPSTAWSTFRAATDFELRGEFTAIPEPSTSVLALAWVFTCLSGRRRFD